MSAQVSPIARQKPEHACLHAPHPGIGNANPEMEAWGLQCLLVSLEWQIFHFLWGTLARTRIFEVPTTINY